MYKIITISVIFIIFVAGFFIFSNRPTSDTAPTISPISSVLAQPSGPAGFLPADQIRSSDVVIRYTTDGFVPSEITVKVGTRVVWVNESNKPIWPASDLHPTHEIYPEFDPQEPYDPGQAWGFTFTKIGSWNFHDHLRASQRGKVTVTE